MDPLKDWDFALPAERIASTPAAERTGSRLMRVPLQQNSLYHGRFSELPEHLRAGDLLVVNDTKVMAARLFAQRATGGRVELVLLRPTGEEVPALARPARKLRVGEQLALEDGNTATITRQAVDGVVHLRLSDTPRDVMSRAGHMPLPPYLSRPDTPVDHQRYQTVYASELGAAAAPTAGLHFDKPLFARLADVGVEVASVTLHVGLGTFRPLRSEDLDAGRLHEERYNVPAQTAAAIAATRRRGGRVVAVGTTSARTLEAATVRGETAPRHGPGATDLFIQPPYTFGSVDGLITNFHLPKSSLLMLVASLIGRQRLLAAYEEAIERGYRFYSYGDAMLLL